MDQGIVAIAVVTATYAGIVKSQGPIEGHGGGVRGCYLQGGPLGPVALAMAEQGLQHLVTEALAAQPGVDGHHGDVQFVDHQPATGHGDQGAFAPKADARSALVSQLAVPLLLVPEATEAALVQVLAGREVVGLQGEARQQLGLFTGHSKLPAAFFTFIGPQVVLPAAMVISSELEPGGACALDGASGSVQHLFEPHRDASSPNRNLAPITAEIDADGRLQVGGCGLSTLARTYGTPLYVLDEASLRATCRAYRQALEVHYPGASLALYASKANSSLAISALVASEGLGLDAVSSGELLTALDGGMPADRIVFHGNNKSRQELALAVERGVTVVADNWRDLELLADLAPGLATPVELMLRFTPGIECHTHEYIRTGHLDSKFGFDPDQLEPVLRHLVGCSWARLTGLHAHIGSQIFELQPHRDLAGVLADALALAQSMGHPVGNLNVGGGLGIRYVASDDPPSIQEWVQTVGEAVAMACQQRGLALPRLLCEPGRSLVATAGVTVYEVGSRKVIPGIRTYLSVDGGMSDNPRPITYQSQYTALLADRPRAEPTETVTVAGKHCESGDVLLKDVALPAATSGDHLVVLATGAYNASMSSNYNRIPRPAAVLVNGGIADLVQRREQPEELLRYDVLPSRLLTVS